MVLGTVITGTPAGALVTYCAAGDLQNVVNSPEAGSVLQHRLGTRFQVRFQFEKVTQETEADKLWRGCSQR